MLDYYTIKENQKEIIQLVEKLDDEYVCEIRANGVSEKTDNLCAASHFLTKASCVLTNLLCDL